MFGWRDGRTKMEKKKENKRTKVCDGSEREHAGKFKENVVEKKKQKKKGKRVGLRVITQVWLG